MPAADGISGLRKREILRQIAQGQEAPVEGAGLSHFGWKRVLKACK
jgi:hypothetical protein